MKTLFILLFFLFGVAAGMIISGWVCQTEYTYANNQYKELYVECMEYINNSCFGSQVNINGYWE